MEENSLWHKVTEKERENIRKDSKKLLNEFSAKLKKIKTKENHFENGTGNREEGAGWKTDEEFKSHMLNNAPFVEDNSIVAEKGNWKK
tara:strand:+ start:398 stop:661 length:264 start_codon:yes stop_codon:yes gene_type:complete